jgi:hypothetical protein
MVEDRFAPEDKRLEEAFLKDTVVDEVALDNTEVETAVPESIVADKPLYKEDIGLEEETRETVVGKSLKLIAEDAVDKATAEI